MTAAFTPGPWRVRTRNDGSRSVTSERYHHPPGEHPWVGGYLHVCDLSGDRHYDEGNARLIAAAPALYKAVTDLLEQFGSYQPPRLEPDEFDPAMEALIRARAALAAARGDSEDRP